MVPGLATVASVILAASVALAAPTRDEAVAAMRAATAYFAGEVAVEGGYVYHVSLDSGLRLGEGEAAATEIWVQPPGTPFVGEALLAAHKATGDPIHLEAAVRAGHALVHGQLVSGGWRNSIDFDPSGPRVGRYRDGRGSESGRDFSTLDDDITQAALRFLMRLDAATGFSDATLRDAIDHALAGLLAAQFPNGGFPQGWSGPTGGRAIVPASLPDYDWRTEGRIREYWNEYTLNDGLALTVTETLLAAHRIHGRPEHLEALTRFGTFLLLAQLPEPQPAWAQQYDAAMRPIWARAFEPPAIAGRESEDAMLALLWISEATGNRAFAAAVEPALRYLEGSLLADGRLARFYELETNRPLYMARVDGTYDLTHDDSRLPAHYSWKTRPRLRKIRDAWEALEAGRPLSDVFAPSPVTAAEAAAVIAALDGEGRWVSIHDGGGDPEDEPAGRPRLAAGERYVSSAVFAENLRTLARYVREVGESG